MDTVFDNIIYYLSKLSVPLTSFDIGVAVSTLRGSGLLVPLLASAVSDRTQSPIWRDNVVRTGDFSGRTYITLRSGIVPVFIPLLYKVKGHYFSV